MPVMDSGTTIQVVSLLVAVAAAVATVFLGLRAVRVAERQTRLGERQVALAERATQPHLWLWPISPDEQEGTGNPMGALHEDGSFGSTWSSATTVAATPSE
jgi:hypothetical protein